jgi:N-acetylglucosamine-6-phosphate deacetylase
MNTNTGFFDIQVNGYAGIDFNQNDLSSKDFHHACEKLKTHGVSGILATVITAGFEEMKTRLGNIVRIRKEDPLVREIVRGIHIEGPFLNREPGYCGAHPKAMIMDAQADKMNELLESAGGLTKLVTLAPEKDEKMIVTRMLADKGITVSAGHCNPSIDELHQALDAGLSMFTHFGNGIPNTIHRHYNILQRVLSIREHLWICYIGDGIHIPFFALKNYLDLTGTDRSIVVTDCMAGAAAPPGRYTISHIELEVGADGVVREPGKENFAGSSATMQKCYNNLTVEMGIDQADVRKLTMDNPAHICQ